jgi:hypothetical protein
VTCGATAGKLCTALPYIPDLTPRILIMLELLKKQLTGNKMAADTGVNRAANSSLQILDTDLLCARTRAGVILRLVLQCQS